MDLASDLGEHGPEPRDYPQGAIADVRDVERNFLDVHVYEVEVPFAMRSCQVCLLTGRGDFIHLNLAGELAHAAERHSLVPLLFKCSICSKEYKSKHGALCHVPKCPGPKNPPAGLMKCDHCDRSYISKIGLSQHERFVHPEERNLARARAHQGALDPGAETRTAPRAGKVFSDDEVATMLELEVRYQGDPRIANKMLPSLPGKTSKQVSDKRCTTSYRRLRDDRLQRLQQVNEEVRIPHQGAPGGRDRNNDQQDDLARERAQGAIRRRKEGVEMAADVPPKAHPPRELRRSQRNRGGQRDEAVVRGLEAAPPGAEEIPVPRFTPAERKIEARAIVETPDIVIAEPDAPPDVATWRARIAQECISHPTKRAMPEAAARAGALLRGALQHALDQDGTLNQYTIDRIYVEATSWLSSSERGVEKRPPSQAARSRRGHRRYVYARSQDIYHKNPGLLAKLVRSGIDYLEEDRQLEETAVGDFYRQLWDPEAATEAIQGEACGSSLPLRTAYEEPLPVETVLPRIVASDIRQRFHKMKSSTAAGLDKLLLNAVESRIKERR